MLFGEGSDRVYPKAAEALTEELFDTQNLCRGVSEALFEERASAFLRGFMNQSRIYIHECFALRGFVEGEAFGYKNLG